MASLFFAINPLAFAHTTINDQGIEGTTVKTYINIPHGCGDATKEGNLGIEAMAVVFPNALDSEPTRDDTGEAISLSEVITGANDHNGGLVVVSPRVVQDYNVFSNITPIRDANNNIHGIYYTDGYLDPGLVGYAPFQATVGSFVPESCAKSLAVKVAIANYCTKHSGVRRADIWIGKLTNVFTDPNIVSVDFWPQLIINRDLENNPLDPSCGEGYDASLEPSAADIDQYLLIDGYQP